MSSRVTRQRGNEATRLHRLLAGATLLGLCASMASLAGCESTRIAIATQARANDVQQTIFDQQQEALRIYQFRALAATLNLPPEQTAVLNAAWNERNTLNWWAVQFERSKSLRLVGVDTKLWASESILELIGKQIEQKTDRAWPTSQPTGKP